ncbi:MAG: Na+/H+ antiporter subunit E [Tissierellales bacterium]|nr:Na+/H+ antiporter subunit E [Tissierellales bacterium]MBN2828131.1 Na+/H+ antiporter subunit E [Tissierellales bacterium]
MQAFLFLSYLFIWMIFSENISAETWLIGIIIVTVTMLINKPLIPDKKSKFHLMIVLYFIKYLVLLMREIVLANIHVAILVLSPSPKLSPVFINYHTILRSDFYKMVFANSITLTPGTISITLNHDTLCIHCLTENFAKEMSNNKFEAILKKMEDLSNDKPS